MTYTRTRDRERFLRSYVQAFLTTTRLRAGERASVYLLNLTFPGLAKLMLSQRNARIGRNPATGEAINITAKKVVKFRVVKAAKDAILGKKEA